MPKALKEMLDDVAEGRKNFKLGDPWKYSEDALAVVVPILRKDAPDRHYVTMYEVLKQLGMKDTGHVDAVEMSNKAGKPVFVRAGTIFEGSTQNRAAENSTVVQPGKAEIPVRCVHQTHGIQDNADMKFGKIAPTSVTINLITGAGQGAVWGSIRDYTSGRAPNGYHRHQEQPTQLRRLSRTVDSDPHHLDATFGRYGHRVSHTVAESSRVGSYGTRSTCLNDSTDASRDHSYDSGPSFIGFMSDGPVGSSGSDDLLGAMRKAQEGQKVFDDMMQKVPLFPDQCGALIFDPVGIVGLELFDHSRSWEAIKKEIIEKYGDKISQKQADHLYELKPDMIMPAFKKFIKKMEHFEEKSIRKDEVSETRVVWGDKVVGEYTLIKDKIVHALVVRES